MERVAREMQQEWHEHGERIRNDPENKRQKEIWDKKLADREARRAEERRDDAFRREHGLPLDGWERQTYDVESSKRELARRDEIEASWEEEERQIAAFDEEVRRQQIDEEYERLQNRVDILDGIVGPRQPEKTRWDYLEL